MPPRFTWEQRRRLHADGDSPGKQRTPHRSSSAPKQAFPKDQLNSEFQAFHERFAKAAPNYIFPDPPFRSVFEPINENILGQFANTLLALLAAVGFLLLIACANVANLLLARASARRGEIAVRAALGAGGKRIVRQLLTESTLLSLTGGALGILFAYAGVKAVVALLPPDSIPTEAVIAINIPVLCFAVAISVLTGMLFGMAPAFQLARQDQSAFLKDAGRGSDTSSTTNRLRNILIVAEVALSLVLLTGAAFAASGLISISRAKLGYDPNGVLITYMPSPAERHPQWSQRRTFFRDIADHLRQIPTVESVVPTIIGSPSLRTASISNSIWPASKNPCPSASTSSASLSSPSSAFPCKEAASSTPPRSLAPALSPLFPTTSSKPTSLTTKIPSAGISASTSPSQDLPAGFVQTPQPPASYEIVGVAGSARNDGLRQGPVARRISALERSPLTRNLVRRPHHQPRSIRNSQQHSPRRQLRRSNASRKLHQPSGLLSRPPISLSQIRHLPLRHLRRHRPRPRHHRHLRRRLLQRRPPHPRIRHPHGPRRHSRQRPPPRRLRNRPRPLDRLSPRHNHQHHRRPHS